MEICKLAKISKNVQDIRKNYKTSLHGGLPQLLQNTKLLTFFMQASRSETKDIVNQ